MDMDKSIDNGILNNFPVITRDICNSIKIYGTMNYRFPKLFGVFKGYK